MDAIADTRASKENSAGPSRNNLVKIYVLSFKKLGLAWIKRCSQK
jgi:hypothetical protein